MQRRRLSEHEKRAAERQARQNLTDAQKRVMKSLEQSVRDAQRADRAERPR